MLANLDVANVALTWGSIGCLNDFVTIISTTK